MGWDGRGVVPSACISEEMSKRNAMFVFGIQDSLNGAVVVVPGPLLSDNGVWTLTISQRGSKIGS